MKLSEKQVTRLSSLILEALKQNDQVEFREKESAVSERIKDVIMNNIKAEGEIDREVKRLMETYSGQIERGEVDSRKIFAMIKSKLAREKGFVL